MIIKIGLQKKLHVMEREHCQIEHRKSKSCPTARQIKFDSVWNNDVMSWTDRNDQGRVSEISAENLEWFMLNEICQTLGLSCPFV